MSKSAKPIVMKGKLKFKGSSAGGAKPKRSVASVSLAEAAPKDLTTKTSREVEVDHELDNLLTDAQKRHMKKQREQEDRDLQKSVKSSYRDRIENFNAKLSTLTEHNDIPRISAAGNG